MKKLKKRDHVLPAALLATGIFLSTAAVIPTYADPVLPLRSEDSISVQTDSETLDSSVIELTADYADDVYSCCAIYQYSKASICFSRRGSGCLFLLKGRERKGIEKV